jgi:predicted secreted protein
VVDREVPAEVSLHVGEEQSFPLPNHGGGGYRWSVSVSGDSVAASVTYDEPGPPPGLGERLGQVLHIRGVYAGEESLALEERRSWEKESPAGALTVRVVVRDSDISQK